MYYVCHSEQPKIIAKPSRCNLYIILKLEIILFEQGSGQFYYFPFEPFRYILLIAYRGKNVWCFVVGMLVYIFVMSNEENRIVK
jgi:hypothetical protein